MYSLFKSLKREDLFFVILLVFASAETLLVQSRGVSVGDEGEYIYAAHDLCHGKIAVLENFFSNRIGITAPIAFAMKMLGWQGMQLTYVSTIIFISLLIFVYIVLSKYDKVIALVTVSLLGAAQIMLVNSAGVMGDMTITLMANAPVLFYFWLLVKWNEGKHHSPVLFGVAAGILFVMAVLTKESVAFFVPLLCLLAYLDRNGEKFTFWKAMFAVTTFAGLLIGLWYWRMTGDFFYRLHAVAGGPSQSDCNYANAPWQVVIKRITYQPVQFLIEDYGLGLLSLLALLNFCRKSGTPEEHFFKIYLLFTLAMWWAGPQGLPWNPVALVSRLWLPLIVPLAINAAIILRAIITGKLTPSEKWLIGGVVVIGLIVIHFSLLQTSRDYAAVNLDYNYSALSQSYYITGMALIAALLVKEDLVPTYLPRPRALLYPLVFASLVGFQNLITIPMRVSSVIEGATALNDKFGLREYTGEREMILYAEKLNPNVVLTDENLSRKYHVYDNFGRDYPFEDWNNKLADKIPKDTYLLINKSRREQASRNLSEAGIYVHSTVVQPYNNFPDYAQDPAKFGFVMVKGTATHELWRKQ